VKHGFERHAAKAEEPMEVLSSNSQLLEYAD
jgi:hypothetical protein